VDRITLAGKELSVSIIYKNIRHTYLRIKTNHTLLITTSKKTKESAIESFIKANETKILKTIEKQSDALIPLIDHEIIYFNKSFPIQHIPSLKKAWIFDGFQFTYKNESTKLKSLKTFYAQAVIQKSEELIEKWRPILSKDINLSGIVIKSRWMKSQFGSCQSIKKIINMNSVLARFDAMYLETILIHELVHLKIQNHGKEYYNYLLRYLPNYHSVRKELGHLFKKIEV